MILSAIISLNSINQLIFVMMNYVLFEVWTEFLSSLLYSRLSSSRVTLLSIFVPKRSFNELLAVGRWLYQFQYSLRPNHYPLTAIRRDLM
jgi:hypothetical protein